MKKTWKIVGRHIFLAVLAFIWLIPIFWLVVTTFSVEKGINTNHFFILKLHLVLYDKIDAKLIENL